MIHKGKMMENMSLKDLMQTLETKLNERYEEYLSWHRELVPFTERELKPEELEQVNMILKNIQDTFAEIYPVYHWITFRNEYATNAMNSYNDFIERLKQNGASYQANEPGFEPAEEKNIEC